MRSWVYKYKYSQKRDFAPQTSGDHYPALTLLNPQAPVYSLGHDKVEGDKTSVSKRIHWSVSFFIMTTYLLALHSCVHKRQVLPLTVLNSGQSRENKSHRTGDFARN